MTVTLRLESYTPQAREHVTACQALADKRGHAEVDPIHLWYELVNNAKVVQDIIKGSGVDPTDVLVESEWLLRKANKNNKRQAYLSGRLLDLLGRAESDATRAGGEQVSTQHLVVACTNERTGPVRTVLRTSGLSGPILRALVRKSKAEPSSRGPSKPDADTMTAFGRDLTALAARDHFDPTIARDAELRRIVQVLARRDENNPLLVGEPGIGKEAIVTGLASRIARNDVPTMLHSKRIVELDMSQMLAGTKLRGQLEERMKKLVADVVASGGDTILFVPRLGAILNAKSGAADMLGSALARGQIRMIAMCTPDELRGAQDQDSSLLERLVPIAVEAPTQQESIAILRGVVQRFEAAHGVKIGDPALVAAVQFARRYVSGVQLPKAAIDLIDETAARVRVEMQSVPAELDALNRRLEAIHVQLASLQDDHDPASKLTHTTLAQEAKVLEDRVADMQSRRADTDTTPAAVGPQDVAEVVALWTGVPVAKMLEEEAQKLLHMEDRLRERVVGQDHAVTALSKAIRRGRVGLRDPKRPIGSFLFLGPTGVGKTELAKALAEFLFDDEAAMTRLDMSEFMEKHMVSRLLGSPPGYVDSDSGGFLTEAVRQRPYSVVLFDEMEKAHPDVFNILLQVLDDGRLTDSRGRVAYFRDTVVIMTSNVGSHLILDHEGDNQELRDILDDAIRDHFRPEFLNRIDDVLIFDPLGKDDLRAIVDIQLRGVSKLLSHRRITLQVTDAAKDQIVELGYQPAYGARPLKRVILKHLQDPLAEQLLRGGFNDGGHVVVDHKAGEFVFSRD